MPSTARYLNFSKFVPFSFSSLLCAKDLAILLSFALCQVFLICVAHLLWQRQNLGDDSLCRDHNSIFVSGTYFSVIGYNIFLAFVKNCTSFHALNKELKDKWASAHFCLCCYFVCIAYSWVFCRPYCRTAGWNGSSWWQDLGGSTAWAGDRTIWPDC